MTNATKGTSGLTVGVDISDKHSHLCLLDADGEVVEESRIRTSDEGFQQRFGAIEPCKVAIEVGTHSPWISRALEACGHEVIIANPRKLRFIYKNDSKDDRVDARYLARIARLDPELLAPVSHRTEDIQADRAVLRARNALVGTRTKLINHIRGAVKSFGGRLPSSSAHSFSKKVATAIPKELRPALSPLLETLAELSKKIYQYDKQINELADRKYPETKLLRQVSGVGALTSLGYVLTIEDPNRFKKSRTVGAYLGLRPRRQESGERAPQLRITKAGDAFVRRLLVGSAQYILGPFGTDSDLRRWGLKLYERGGKNAKKRATVAVARKLAILLHRLWTTGEVYEPFRNLNIAA